MRPSYITNSQWIKYNIYFIIEHFIGINNSERFLRNKKSILFDEISKNPGIKKRAKTYYNADIESVSVEDLVKNRGDLMHQPILFKGAAKEWPCVKKWNKDYFKDHFANSKVSLVGNIGLVDKDKQNTFHETNMSNFIDDIGKDVKNYLRFSRIVDEDPKLRKDIDVSWLEKFKGKFSRGGYLYLFMGEKGSKTSMHNAIIQSLFVQIKGKKKWTIYEPNERIFLEPVADRRPYYYTDANPNNENDPKFPLLKYAKKYEITLEEGDVLWFPTFYWHYVENLSENIGVTYKFTDFKVSFKKSKVLTSLLFLSTKPTMIETFIHNVFKKKDLHFEKNI